MDTRIEWATAAIARFLPRLGASLRYWAAKYLSLVLAAAWAASVRAAFIQGLPLPVRPLCRLPALSLLPGLTLAQEARCAAVGNWLMSVPVSANSSSALRRPTP